MKFSKSDVANYLLGRMTPADAKEFERQTRVDSELARMVEEARGELERVRSQSALFGLRLPRFSHKTNSNFVTSVLPANDLLDSKYDSKKEGEERLREKENDAKENNGKVLENNGQRPASGKRGYKKFSLIPKYVTAPPKASTASGFVLKRAAVASSEEIRARQEKARRASQLRRKTAENVLRPTRWNYSLVPTVPGDEMCRSICARVPVFATPVDVRLSEDDMREPGVSSEWKKQIAPALSVVRKKETLNPHRFHSVNVDRNKRTFWRFDDWANDSPRVELVRNVDGWTSLLVSIPSSFEVVGCSNAPVLNAQYWFLPVELCDGELSYRRPEPAPTPVAEPIPTPVAEPIPTPVVEPVPTPVVEPVPTPVAEPIPTPVVEPVPTPVVEPVPTPVVEPVPTPVVEPVPTPVVEPVPTPVVEPVPTPVAEPIPTPVAEPIPTPVVEPVPTPVVEPVPTPVVEPVPTPVAAPISTPVVEPVPTPVAEPIPTPVVAPIPTPVAEPIPTPVAEPIPTPVAEPIPTPVAEPISTPVVEPIPTPVAEPIPTPVAEPIPTPVAEPISTPVVEPIPTPVAEPIPTPVVAPIPTPIAEPVPIPNLEPGLAARSCLETSFIPAEKTAILPMPSPASYSVKPDDEDREVNPTISAEDAFLAELLGREPTPIELDEYYWEDLVEENKKTVTLPKIANAALMIITEPPVLVGRFTIGLFRALLPKGYSRGEDFEQPTRARRKQSKTRLSDMMISMVAGVMIAVCFVFPALRYVVNEIFVTVAESKVRKLGENVSLTHEETEETFLPLVTEHFLFPRYDGTNSTGDSLESGDAYREESPQ